MKGRVDFLLSVQRVSTGTVDHLSSRLLQWWWWTHGTYCTRRGNGIGRNVKFIKETVMPIFFRNRNIKIINNK